MPHVVSDRPQVVIPLRRAAARRVAAFRFVAVFSAASCLVGAAGCGPKTIASTTGTVSGTVTFKGTPLTSGMVQIAASADAAGWSGNIGATGGYQVSTVTPGTYKMWLTPESFPGVPPDRRFNSLPDAYLSPATTPLSVTVTPGGTTDFPIAIGE